MRVAFIDQDAQLGGVEYSTLRAAQALDKTRFEPLIICPIEGDLPRLAREAGLTVRIVPRPKFSSVSILLHGRYIANPFGFLQTAANVYRAMRTLRASLCASAVDVIITKGLLAHFYGGWAARALRIPCIWYVQEEVAEKRAAGMYRALLNWGAQNLAARVIVDANALLDQFKSASALRHAVGVIYNGTDTQQFAPFTLQEQRAARQSFGLPLDATVIGQAGRIIPLKGQATLLQAFTALAGASPALHLLFVGAPLFGGQDYEQALRAQAAQYGLTDRVHFAGFVPDVRQGLAAMDIFVHASTETDSPLSVMEAMACGLPLVVSNVRGTVEMIEPEVDALLFEAGNSKALQTALERLLSSKALRQALSGRTATAILDKFSLQASVKQLQTLIEEVYAA